MKQIIFLSAIFISLLFFSSHASASNCEDVYGGGCAISCTDSYGAESISLGSSSSYGCPLSCQCCVLPCEGPTIRSRYSEATCMDKTSGNCEQELEGVLDCQSKLGSNGICCIKPKSTSGIKGCCVKDTANSSNFGPSNCISNMSLGECGSYGNSTWDKSESDCSKNTNVSKYCTTGASPGDCATLKGTCKDDAAGGCTGDTHPELGIGHCPSGQVCCVPNSSTTSTGIVPCGGPSDPCTLCHLIIGFHNLIDWGKNILVTITLVAIFLAGIMYTVSTGNEKMISQAKSFLSASLVGFAITLAAWLIVNATIYWVANANQDLGIRVTNWNTFNCNPTNSIK